MKEDNGIRDGAVRGKLVMLQGTWTTRDAAWYYFKVDLNQLNMYCIVIFKETTKKILKEVQLIH